MQQGPVLETVRFLQREGLDKLCKRFNLTKKRHQKYPNLVGLKYDQVRANFSSRIVRECRGLIVNEDANWSVVAWPFTKFFNRGEQFADEIDWSTATFYEKLDGSLCTLYFYQKEWHISSVGMPDAAGKLQCVLPGHVDIWKKLSYALPKSTDTCYMFEMLSERNRIIVPQKKDRIVFIGSRNLKSGEEAVPEPTAQAHGWECVGHMSVPTLEVALQGSRTMNPMEHEGFVVCDSKFRRLKIKSPQYVALSYMSERNKNPRVNARNLVELVRANEGSEFLSYYPEWKAPYEKTKTSFDKLVTQLESNTAEGELAVQCAAATKDGSASSVRNFLATCPIEALLAAVSVGADDKAVEEDEAPIPAEPEAAKKEEPKKKEELKPEPLQPQRRRKQGAPVNMFELLNEN